MPITPSAARRCASRSSTTALRLFADDLRSALAQIEDVLGDLELRVDVGAGGGS
jgi:hypothetical protein